MSILMAHELSGLKNEIKEIKKIIGIEDDNKLLLRVQKIIDRLDISKTSRIKRVGLKLI